MTLKSPRTVPVLRTTRRRDAAVRFAVKVAHERGHVSEDDLQAVKAAGYDDAQIIEIVLHVALNTWTNYINEVAKTDIDFPVVSAPGVCATALPTREDTTAGYPAAL